MVERNTGRRCRCQRIACAECREEFDEWFRFVSKGVLLSESNMRSLICVSARVSLRHRADPVKDWDHGTVARRFQKAGFDAPFSQQRYFGLFDTVLLDTANSGRSSNWYGNALLLTSRLSPETRRTLDALVKRGGSLDVVELPGKAHKEVWEGKGLGLEFSMAVRRAGILSLHRELTPKILEFDRRISRRSFQSQRLIVKGE